MLMQSSQKVVKKAMLIACKCNCKNGKQTKQNHTNYLFKINYKQHTIYQSTLTCKKFIFDDYLFSSPDHVVVR